MTNAATTDETTRQRIVIPVRIVQLCDATGKVQILFPQDHLLDMVALNRATKRRLEPIANVKLTSEPLTRSRHFPTVIDDTLLNADRLLIPLDDEKTKEVVPSALQDQFSPAICQIASISLSPTRIATPVENHLDDEQQMLNALGRFQSIRLKQRLAETLELPPLPASSQQIIQLCAKKDAGTDELCRVISLDPSLAAQVVSWASSPYYGSPSEIESVEDAIIRVLGFDMVMNLALGLSMSKAFDLPKNGPRHYQDYWQESVECASLMEALVKRMPASKRPRLGHAYLSGLLHNFGYLAISHILPPHFSILSRNLEANAHLPSELLEMHLLRFTKEQLGSWLLRQWGIPDSICDAIRYAKSPSYQGANQMLARLLHMSLGLLKKQTLSDDLAQSIGLTLADCQATYKQVRSASTNIKQMVSLISGHAPLLP